MFLRAGQLAAGPRGRVTTVVALPCHPAPPKMQGSGWKWGGWGVGAYTHTQPHCICACGQMTGCQGSLIRDTPRCQPCPGRREVPGCTVLHASMTALCPTPIATWATPAERLNSVDKSVGGRRQDERAARPAWPLCLTAEVPRLRGASSCCRGDSVTRRGDASMDSVIPPSPGKRPGERTGAT